MTKSTIKQRLSALFLLAIFSLETFYPRTSYALTSGPTTPDMSAFEPASTANMVDLFSGDFAYNIPLLDVGGYPVNLAYHSGAGPEEEASWVGFGWSLNPGAINRQLRGLPDDFKGDVVTQEDNKKANITVGGNVNASIKLFGYRLPKLNIGRKKKNLGGSVKVKIGILHNNYTGYKGMIGIGTAFNTSDDNSDALTKGLGPASSADLSAGLGLNVDNQSGINPYANFEVNYKIRTLKERQAEKDLYIAEKEHAVKTIINSCFKSEIYDLKESSTKIANISRILNRAQDLSSNLGTSASISFGAFQPPASVQTPMTSKNFTASLALGITLFGGTVAPGIEGTYSKQELKDPVNSAPAYGFMNSHEARSKEEALLDYNMEKESPYFKRLPNLGVTVFTPDLYSVTSNAGSMQFRPYLKGTGIFFQPHKHDVDKSVDIGLEPAFGNLFHIGIPLQLNKTNNISGKWTSKNDYLSLGDFKSTDPSTPANQAYYFKRVGEKNLQDTAYFNAIGKTSPVAVRLDNSVSAWAFGNGKALAQMKRKNGADLSGPQARGNRDKANHSIAFLTASEASMYALQKQIPNYRENTLITESNAIKNYISRSGGYRLAHHISQYTITQDDGQRMVYGAPVYNTTQQEVSFAIPHNAAAAQSGIATYNAGSDNSINNPNGKDRYYHKSITPAYTTGHLLTGILSPDYVDVSGNGITDDDLGSAVKFNYSELSDGAGNAKLYKWRTPYTNVNGNASTANYNTGYKSIPDDDKGNYTWGQKELWYLHSIESKTMVAQFYTEDREDGIGVAGENGSKDAAIRMKRLKEIRLYSKSDLYANGANAVPIKTVHLEYYDDYPILNQLPNSVNGKGKLTLKAVWFSYGKNNKGQYNKYNFKYKIPASQNYEDNQSDRWGSYKPKSANPNGLDNLEFPYSTQNKADADNFASNWQLNEIELPSGGIINVQYEADDYSYVQDRRAMQMCFMTGIGSNGSNTGFTESDKFYVKLPAPTTDADLRKRYFDGVKSLAYKSYVDLDGKGHYEFVSGYADVSSYRLINVGSGNDIVEITVGKINGYNPLSKSAWQKLKLDVPRYAYPEYDNLDSENSGFISAIRALGAAFGRFKDLVESFDKRANRKGFGNRVDLAKSWVRLCTPIGINNTIKGKLGGGHRVKEIRITDQWRAMSGVSTAEDGSYGQTYEYTTEYNGPGGIKETISSGVASYEPTSGGDENPFHEPINYVDKHLFGLPKYFYLERPMGESYFPGPSVGYSKVVVKNIGADGSVGANGKSVSEFFTAKDFPTKVDELPIERKQPKLSFLPRLFGAKLTTGVTVSQGYVIENNDMHGKPKAEADYGKNGDEISSAKYYYKVDNPAAEKLDLNNNVAVVTPDGNIRNNALIGMDIDMFTEMNESMMENMGIAVDPSFGVTLYGIIPKFSIRLPLPKPNYEKRLYRGSTTVKLVNRYAIMEKAVKTVNGSTSISENMLWDAETGEVLLTKVNNEFNDNTYTFNYPAHWAYDGMGSAFKNEGVYLVGFTSNASGLITTTYNNLLVPGDEVVDINTSNKYWVSNPNNNSTRYLIDKDGITKTVSGINVKIMRSGRRNLASASIGSVVSMSNPIASGSISFSQATRVLQAKSVNYSQDWPMPVSYKSGPVHYTPDDCTMQGKGAAKATAMDSLVTMEVVNGRPVYKKTAVAAKKAVVQNDLDISCTCACLKAFFDYLINTNQLFITQGQNKTVGQLVSQANTAGYNVGTCDVLQRNMDKLFYALTSSPTSIIYSAQVGDCVISIRSSNSTPITFSTLVSRPCDGTPTVKYQNTPSNITKTVYIECGNKKVMTGNNGYAYSGLGDKIEMAHIDQGFGPFPWYYSDSWFRFLHSGPAIPAGATFNSATFYLYAYPTGFYPPYLPNAHSPMNTINNINRLSFVFPNMHTPSSCNSSYNSWWGRRFATQVTQPYQDIAESMTYGEVLSALDDGWMGLEVDPFNPYISLSDKAYYSFCSHLYSNSAKRPRLEINYSFPATVVATLQIDDCVGTICTEPIVNPYTTGLKGNWRSKKELLYDAKRVNLKGDPLDPSGTQLRTSGHFDSFTPYWQPSGGSWAENVSDPKWQWTSVVNKFNRKGQEVENMDALGRYSAAQHGYLESVPVAVASNAMYREIGFDGFEDYNFNLGLSQLPWDSCAIQDHFNFRRSLGTGAALDNTRSHSGKYSLKLTGTAAIDKPTLTTEPSSIYSIVSNQYKITNGYLRFGFVPVPAKKYIISGWVNDGQPKSAAINGLTFKINGVTYNLNDNAVSPAVYSKVHVVEGWKRFEVVFTMPSSANFRLEMTGSNINVDDIRIHPYDGQLKSYAYDASSMRLMADLDENNFATFYEYDDEGTLIRVKKETEKGISTIKETRSSIRRKP